MDSPCLRWHFLGNIPVHNDHDVFIRGIEQKRRLKLTFFCRDKLQHIVRQCAPLHYSKGKAKGDGLDCYYIWVFEAVRDGHFLALLPLQIITMELTEETFGLEDIDSRQRQKEKVE